ncbi:hypothetical protein [Streptomyces tanashiensis]|uniref:Uncharacterized protein n=1 Tax=Streptomyces tanashiensis TaxID=67367 RepID=A0ABY6R7Q2_9ACTN|nr:hypothetical protein [Streptomyces tanashiensis]UZX26105.1 hypothetical protein LDH80_37905 [Streptomyces tanashiensis]GGY34595.1 hypothetical protein GCM10010299_46410 [Streptomyces tanashiensis]
MSELPPDPPRLRTLETWLTVSLERVGARIAEVEIRDTDLPPGVTLTVLAPRPMG